MHDGGGRSSGEGCKVDGKGKALVREMEQEYNSA